MYELVKICLFDKPLFYLLCLHIWELSSFSALLFSVKHETLKKLWLEIVVEIRLQPRKQIKGDICYLRITGSKV